MKIWLDGDMVDADNPGFTARVAVATLACPLAFVDPSHPAAVEFASQELQYAANILGHRAPPAHELAERLALDARDASEVLTVALVPTRLPTSGLARWDSSELYLGATNVPAEGSVFRAFRFDAPLNERGAAVELRVTADAELGVATRTAQEHGADVALRRNLSGRLARVDRWSVVVAAAQGPVTPPRAEGAPFDAWRDALVRRGVLREESIDESALSRGGALIAGWGHCYALRVEDGGDVAANALAEMLNQELHLLRP